MVSELMGEKEHHEYPTLRFVLEPSGQEMWEKSSFELQCCTIKMNQSRGLSLVQRPGVRMTCNLL